MVRVTVSRDRVGVKVCIRVRLQIWVIVRVRLLRLGLRVTARVRAEATAGIRGSFKHIKKNYIWTFELGRGSGLCLEWCDKLRKYWDMEVSSARFLPIMIGLGVRGSVPRTTCVEFRLCLGTGLKPDSCRS